MEIDLGKVPATGVDRDDLLLFSETQSRFVVTISPDKKKPFEKAFEGIPYGLVGEVTLASVFRTTGLSGRETIRADIQDLKKAWKRPLGS
jgi:phosphoribosylformylglycinamidine synthase